MLAISSYPHCFHTLYPPEDSLQSYVPHRLNLLKDLSLNVNFHPILFEDHVAMPGYIDFLLFAWKRGLRKEVIAPPVSSKTIVASQ